MYPDLEYKVLGGPPPPIQDVASGTVEPLNKVPFGFVLSREVVLFSEIKNELLKGEECPLLGGCPFIGGSTVHSLWHDTGTGRCYYLWWRSKNPSWFGQ